MDELWRGLYTVISSLCWTAGEPPYSFSIAENRGERDQAPLHWRDSAHLPRGSKTNERHRVQSIRRIFRLQVRIVNT